MKTCNENEIGTDSSILFLREWLMTFVRNKLLATAAPLLPLEFCLICGAFFSFKSIMERLESATKFSGSFESNQWPITILSKFCYRLGF